MRSYVHKKGRKYAPRFPKRRKGVFRFSVKFDDSCMYSLPQIHEHNDWNKLIGVKCNFFAPMKGSLMVGWRRPTIKGVRQDYLQVCDYEHDEKGKVIKERIVMNVLLSDTLEGEIDMNTGALYLTLGHTSKTLQTDYRHGKGWQIIHHFGGTSRPPQDIKISYELD